MERVAFDDTITEINDVPGITEIIVSSNGDSTFVMGTVQETTVTTIEKRQYVRYKLLEVPVIFGWHTKDRNDTGWTFGVEAGVVPNLSLRTNGFIFDEDLESIDIGSNQELSLIHISEPTRPY